MQTEFEQWELVEVSDDWIDWKEVRFNWLTIGLLRIAYPYYTEKGCYAFCRKIDKKEDEKKYAIFIEWRGAPTKLNHTLESAKIEAERLSNKENKQAYIVRLVWVQNPKVVSEFTSL